VAVPGDPAAAGHHLGQLPLTIATAHLVDRAERLVDRLRSLPEPRLARREAPDRPSVAEAAHALAQLLADLAADAGGDHRREVPRLSDLAVGDQVAVTLHDLVATLEGRDPEPPASVALAAVADLRAQIERTAPGLPAGRT